MIDLERFDCERRDDHPGLPPQLRRERGDAAQCRADDDLIIVNSCAVTAEAVRQTRQAIRRARRERPEARIVVTGCAAQLEPDAFAAMPEVDRGRSVARFRPRR